MKKIFALSAIFLLAACVSNTSPEALLRDKNASEIARKSAIDQLALGKTEPLWRVVLNNDEPMSLRTPAAEKLLAQDENGFWKRLEKDYKRIHQGPMLDWICAQAQNENALRTLVLFNGQRDQIRIEPSRRPEPEAIARIGHQNAEHVLSDLVCGKKEGDDKKIQMAALFGLTRIWGASDPRIGNLLNAMPHPLLATKNIHLCAWPQVEEEIEIVNAQECLPRGENNTPVFPRGLPLARRNLLATSFTPLGPPVMRTQDAPLLTNTLPSATDIAVCAEMVRGLKDPNVVASLFAEADDDIDDEKSEHGGLLRWNEKNEVIFEAIAPALRRHNETYLPPESLFEKLRDGLAHVHFHAQRYENGVYAGPGKGDLEFVENNRVNAVVFTFINKDTLDCDAYFAGKIVVDLGCIKRTK